MSLAIGIVGLPNVGKSTLFNALTDNDILAANYPFATIEPNTGIVPIPDPRLQKLAELYKTQKTVPATVTFVDIAGLVAGASMGEGLGNQFLANIRTCNAIAHVVRAFDDPNVIHTNYVASSQTSHSSEVQGAGEQRTETYIKYGEGVAEPATQQFAESASDAPGFAGRQAGAVRSMWDPKKDIDIINTELILADIQAVERRLPRLEKEARADSKLKPLLDTLKSIHESLNDGKTVNESFRPEELEGLEDLQLLTMKPVIYVFNVDERALTDDKKQKELAGLAAPARSVFVCAKIESELRGLDETDRTELLNSYGQVQSGLVQVIHAAYDILGLQSYLTAGEKEVRAWTIQKGATAPQAAGVIHSDFERGFIAAQVVNYDDLVTAGSEAAAKAAGKVRTEGKTYIMEPNDVVEFRFNV